MGHQINFYLNAQDQSDINQIIFETFPEILILKDDMERNELEFLQTTEIKSDGRDPTRVYLTEKTFLKHVIINSPIKMTIPPYRLRYILNQDSSCIVEYWRCILDLKSLNYPIIRRGRLYYLADYYMKNSQVKITKDPKFLIFSQKLFGVFKKKLNYRRETGAYYGAGALIDEKNGWKLMM